MRPVEKWRGFQKILTRTIILNKMKFAGIAIGVAIVLAGCGGYFYTTVGGTVKGLGSGDVLVLRNDTNYRQTLSADGPFSFNVASNGSYTISVLTQPNTTNCSVANASGTMTGEAAVSNVVVTCVPNVQIGGTVSGLADSATLTLFNNGTSTATVTANGSYVFSTYVVNANPYAITVGVPPASQYCTVANGTGIADITNTAAALTSSVTCVPAVPVKFTVNGLTAGLTLTMANTVNGFVDRYSVTAPGNYSFNWSWLTGTAFNATVDTQPTGQTCTVTGNTGIIDASNPAASANIVVNCVKS